MAKPSALSSLKNTPLKSGAGALLKRLLKVLIIVLMSYGPAGVTSWLLKTVSRKPLRFALAMLLEPLFRKVLCKACGRYAKENNETTEK
ncbi:phage shock protein PspD [Serratia aquatilis]|uniref:Phage shock protein PspD n=1 Tax=Serratia aquatilis TaxID=1737515 RepID=A0ABV6EAC2_9GAMM